MEVRNLTQKDLWRIFGLKAITSGVFHGKRSSAGLKPKN
jgi:antitoxin component HigA of HigAB toxin-antitoxin module